MFLLVGVLAISSNLLDLLYPFVIQLFFLAKDFDLQSLYQLGVFVILYKYLQGIRFCEQRSATASLRGLLLCYFISISSFYI